LIETDSTQTSTKANYRRFDLAGGRDAAPNCRALTGGPLPPECTEDARQGSLIFAIVFAVVSARREKELFVALAYTSAGFSVHRRVF
jgi:hypothetical protein